MRYRQINGKLEFVSSNFKPQMFNQSELVPSIYDLKTLKGCVNFDSNFFSLRSVKGSYLLDVPRQDSNQRQITAYVVTGIKTVRYEIGPLLKLNGINVMSLQGEGANKFIYSIYCYVTNQICNILHTVSNRIFL